jgi:phenylpyruvate tautomerase PptA (4-oxalocrotonate tautomerase family)
MAETKTDILQDPFEVGKNYVGVGSVGLLSVSKPFRYAFVLWSDITKPLFLSDGDRQVILPFPPEAFNIDEQAATTITYTQNSGKFVERRGQLSKNIVLSGTTGFNYNPKYSHTTRQFLTPGLIVEGEGPNSGFGRFLALRNIFREYWATFSDDSNLEKRDKTAMVFINEKDDENWIVEPMSFKMQRQSPRDKFMYHYEIVLQTIAPADGIYLIDDPTTIFQDIGNFIQIVRQVADTTSKFAASISNAMAKVTGAVREATQTLVTIINTISAAATDIAEGKRLVMELPDLIKGDANNIKGSFQGAYENWLTLGDKVAIASGSNPIPFEATLAATQVASVIGGLAGRSKLFNMSLPSVWVDRVLNLYNPVYGFGGFNQILLGPLSKSGVKEVEILPGDDLVRIATRSLGSAERFMEIVVLNNLKPPYISPTAQARLPNTLAPGDPILVPAIGTASAPRAPIKTTVYTDPTFTGNVLSHSGFTTIVETNGRTYRTNQWQGFYAEIVTGAGAGQKRLISENDATSITVEKAWDTNPNSTSVIRFFLKRTGMVPQKSADDQVIGVDLMLKNNDMAVSAKGDLQTVSGSDNMVQAINTKLKTRPGELAAHPSFGLGFPPGQKATPDTLLAYKVAVRQLLLSDRRIAAVQQMVVSADADKLELQAYVVLSGSSQPFSVDTRGGK